MIYKLQSPKPGQVRVVFELPSCIWADRIYLTGDFNDWDESCQPMYQSRSGVWRTELDLPAGRRYEFRYVIDGRWRTDYHADGFTTNRYGTDNSVVFTELPPAQVASQKIASQAHEQSKSPVGTDESTARDTKVVSWLARPKPIRTVESAA